MTLAEVPDEHFFVFLGGLHARTIFMKKGNIMIAFPDGCIKGNGVVLARRMPTMEIEDMFLARRVIDLSALYKTIQGGYLCSG